MVAHHRVELPSRTNPVAVVAYRGAQCYFSSDSQPALVLVQKTASEPDRQLNRYSAPMRVGATDYDDRTIMTVYS